MTTRLKIDLTGARFGRLLVHSYAGMVGTAPSWLCQCDCGVEKIIPSGNLRLRGVISCGCYHAENLTSRNLKHGHKTRGGSTPKYRTWSNMRGRCEDVTNMNYPRYGGRGIAVCERWQRFENFLHDMGPRPSPLHSLDRRENDGNYEPDNCRWATRREQMANMSRNRLVDWNGELVIQAEAARRAGLTVSGLRYRLLVEALRR